MEYVSTRGGDGLSLDHAIVQGIASDGGLFLPKPLPEFTIGDFDGCGDIASVAKVFLSPFFSGSSLVNELDAIISETFHFELPVRRLPVAASELHMLELYHGPTAAFKDVGAGFLAACLSRLEGDASNPLTVLVATSGDTGGAVAAAFNERPGMRVVVLYPDGMVSERQKHQLTCWGSNVLSLAVQGTFDDCQRIVKEALANKELTGRHRFSSANSINIGRLLPQSIYYAYTSLRHHRSTGKRPAFVVPTGNLGNAFACYLARKAGLPIGDLILATNANRIIVDFLGGAAWDPRTSIQTLASAMDVGNPSNMERLRSVGGEADQLSAQVEAVSVSDAEISRQIKRDFQELQQTSCPHTAAATHVWGELSAQRRRDHDWIVVATAHAAKFAEIVEPIIETDIELPAALAAILDLPSSATKIDPTLADFSIALEQRFST